jgi:putative ABC transport system permease protein
MAIPLSYNFRNLMVRKMTTVMTSAGIMLSVAVLVASLALVNGLRTVFANTGHPLQLLVLRNGGTSELGSLVPTDSFAILRSKAGVAIDGKGEALVAPELVNVANLPSVDNPKGMNITVRGINPVGIEMRSVRLTDGRWFRSGQREIVIGKSVARRYPTAKLGNRIRFGKGDWEIVGITDGGESALNSEIWGDFNQIASDYNRQDSASSVLVRATDPVTLDANAITERDYYASQTASGAPLEFLGVFVAVAMAIGSGFATTNTMYAAVAKRSKEIGTLRTLGFSEASILLSFLTESVLIAVLAGALGCALVLPLNWVTSGIGSFVSFSEIAFRFRVDLTTIASGVIFSVVLGVLGGVLPARAAAKKEIIAALREG